jgi:hypothetical protein
VFVKFKNTQHSTSPIAQTDRNLLSWLSMATGGKGKLKVNALLRQSFLYY